MSDLITEALSGWEDEREREASGCVEGHDIRVEKIEYDIKQRGPTAWKVAVYVDDDGPVATEQKKELNSNEAQRIFDNLVASHSLTEQ